MDEATVQAKRTMLRVIPYGLYVVTARGSDGASNGFTANWVTQAGFEPPMLSVAIVHESRTLELIRSSSQFAVTMMPEDSRDLVRRLGRPYFKAPDKLDGLSLHQAAHGTPVLADGLGYVECAVRGELEYGADHRIIVGEVIDAGVFLEGDIQTMRAAGMKYSG